MKATFLHPPTLHRELGPYSHVASVDLADVSRLVFISGQVGVDREGHIVGGRDDLAAHLAQVFDNLAEAITAAGGTMTSIVSLRTFVSRGVDLEELRELRRQQNERFFGDGEHPTNAVVIVHALYNPDLLVEIEAVAAL